MFQFLDNVCGRDKSTKLGFSALLIKTSILSLNGVLRLATIAQRGFASLLAYKLRSDLSFLFKLTDRKDKKTAAKPQGPCHEDSFQET